MSFWSKSFGSKDVICCITIILKNCNAIKKHVSEITINNYRKHESLREVYTQKKNIVSEVRKTSFVFDENDAKYFCKIFFYIFAVISYCVLSYFAL